MKILVCLKQVPHQDARLDVRPDGGWIQEDNIKFEINSYDTYALEEALRVKDATQAEVVVVSIGPERVTQALRTALGMGADRAIHVKDPAGGRLRSARNRQGPGRDRQGRESRPDLHRLHVRRRKLRERAADAGGAGGDSERHRGGPGRAQERHAERLARDRRAARRRSSS